jgi:phosphomannomutase
MKIFLFDIDGTVTEARKPITKKMLKTLNKLSKRGLIGFVTGSNYDYIKEQILNYISPKKHKSLLKNLILLPCNGTKKFVYDFEEKNWEQTYSNNLKNIITQNQYNCLLKILFNLQLSFVDLFENSLLTGNFVSYRESMVNWCPIGRDSKDIERKWFMEKDKETGYRKTTIEVLKQNFKEINIDFDVKFGGDTSFDIFPTGWDKTYALKHFDKSQNDIYFFGDRCFEGGNDYEIFLAVNQIKKGNGIFVDGIDDTIEEINDRFLI